MEVPRSVRTQPQLSRAPRSLKVASGPQLTSKRLLSGSAMDAECDPEDGPRTGSRRITLSEWPTAGGR